jgi:hypothetical protein
MDKEARRERLRSALAGRQIKTDDHSYISQLLPGKNHGFLPHPYSSRSYRGRDPRKRKKAADHNRDVAELERKINDMLRDQKEPIKVYTWATIASHTGMSYDFIQKVGYSIDGGSNGFTATVPGGISDFAAAVKSI